MQTEDEADAGKPSLGAIRGDIAFEDVWFEYNEGQPVLKGVIVPRRAGHDDGAGRLERIGQEHADQPGDGVQPAAQGPHRSSTASDLDRHPAARLPRAAGVGAAGELPVRRHHRRRTSATRSPARRSTRSSAAAQLAHCEEFILQVPRGLRHHRRRARHQAVAAASASACRSRARSWRRRRC